MIKFQGEVSEQVETFLSFASSQDEEEILPVEQLVKLAPYGVSFATDSQRPFLLLKDDAAEHTLPVAISPIEAGVTLTQHNQSVAPTTPHRFSIKLMEALGLTAVRCVFVQVKGQHQYVRIVLEGHPTVKSVRLRADEAMSLCLSLELPIYASRSLIQRSKVLSAEIEGLGRNLKDVPLSQIKPDGYMM